jgi:hypothetical protein
MTFLPSSCSLPLSLLKPAPPLMAVIRHCPHVDTSFHAIHKNYLWSLSAIRVTATFPYLLMQHVTPSLSLFHILMTQKTNPNPMSVVSKHNLN